MSQTLSSRLGLRANQGDVGLEVEVEWPNERDVLGIRVGHVLLTDKHHDRMWLGHPDNSLRNGMEYVVDRPIAIDDMAPALTNLFSNLPKPLRWSQRTSVHCHFNQLSTPVLKVYNNILGFWVFEDLILEMCAPHRRGNLFALPWRLAEYQVTALVDDFKKLRAPFTSFNPERFKYACLNLCNLARIGTLEFRALEGTEDVDKIVMIFQGIHDLFKNLGKFKDPSELFDWFYQTKDAQEVIDRLFPNELGKGLKKIKDYQDKIQDSIALLSYAAYLPWSNETTREKSAQDDQANMFLNEANNWRFVNAVQDPRPAPEVRVRANR